MTGGWMEYPKEKTTKGLPNPRNHCFNLLIPALGVVTVVVTVALFVVPDGEDRDVLLLVEDTDPLWGVNSLFWTGEVEEGWCWLVADVVEGTLWSLTTRLLAETPELDTVLFNWSKAGLPLPAMCGDAETAGAKPTGVDERLVTWVELGLALGLVSKLLELSGGLVFCCVALEMAAEAVVGVVELAEEPTCWDALVDATETGDGSSGLSMVLVVWAELCVDAGVGGVFSCGLAVLILWVAVVGDGGMDGAEEPCGLLVAVPWAVVEDIAVVVNMISGLLAELLSCTMLAVTTAVEICFLSSGLAVVICVAEPLSSELTPRQKQKGQDDKLWIRDISLGFHPKQVFYISVILWLAETNADQNPQVINSVLVSCLLNSHWVPHSDINASSGKQSRGWEGRTRRSMESIFIVLVLKEWVNTR